MQYGSTSHAVKPNAHAIFQQGKRKRMNVVAVCLNLFIPWGVFCGMYAALSFSLHYHNPVWCWIVGFLAVMLVLWCAGQAYLSRKRGRDAMWWAFSTFAMANAVFFGVLIGDMNFWYNMQPFYDISQLNTYPNINPANTKGQQLMDAGRVYFVEKTRIETKFTMGFKNNDLYCAAPIVVGDSPLDNYDFWAVGLNCCTGIANDFRCPDIGNSRARNGLRLMRDDQRPFYRLAVQQAEAAYGIKAAHPLFFYWMQDPIAEMNSYKEDGFKFYLMGIFTHFIFNLLCVVCAVIGFTKMHY